MRSVLATYSPIRVILFLVALGWLEYAAISALPPLAVLAADASDWRGVVRYALPLLVPFWPIVSTLYLIPRLVRWDLKAVWIEGGRLYWGPGKSVEIGTLSTVEPFRSRGIETGVMLNLERGSSRTILTLLLRSDGKLLDAIRGLRLGLAARSVAQESRW